jgi:hypothetical protein
MLITSCEIRPTKDWFTYHEHNLKIFAHRHVCQFHILLIEGYNSLKRFTFRHIANVYLRMYVDQYEKACVVFDLLFLSRWLLNRQTQRYLLS